MERTAAGIRVERAQMPVALPGFHGRVRRRLEVSPLAVLRQRLARCATAIVSTLVGMDSGVTSVLCGSTSGTGSCSTFCC